MMNRLIYILILFTLATNLPCSDAWSQQNNRSKQDTLILGGIYKVTLNNGKDYTGELTAIRDSSIVILIGTAKLNIKRYEIKEIEIPGMNNNEKFVLPTGPVNKDADEFKKTYYEDNGKKFKLFGSVQTGYSIPTGDINNNYKTSSGFQISIYNPISRVTAFGAEYQYNNFHGTVYYKEFTYYYDKIKTESFNLSMFKINFLVGNLRPEYDGVFYFLLGLGMQYYSEGEVTITTVRHSSSYENKYRPQSGTSFQYGLGAGLFYKVTKMIGIDFEFQFNKLSPMKSYTGSGGGFYSIKAGITYTNF